MKVTAIIEDDLINQVMAITKSNKTNSLKIALEYYINKNNVSNALKLLNNDVLITDSLTKEELQELIDIFLNTLKKLLSK